MAMGQLENRIGSPADCEQSKLSNNKHSAQFSNSAFKAFRGTGSPPYMDGNNATMQHAGE